MAKLIFRCNYFKNESKRHKSNYVKYLGTREGVEFNPEELPEAFYEDFDMHGKKENYVDYVAGRPGVIQVPGQRHGLFSEKGQKVDLEKVMKEVAEHKGMVWINVISLRREDAERLGYDKLESWQTMLRLHVKDISNSFRISARDLRWYAAFHNEGHHPHVHLLVYSEGREGYLDREGIRNLKSKMTRHVFREELNMLYDEKTKQRKTVKEKAGEELLASMRSLSKAQCNNPVIEAKMRMLGERLCGLKGKKVYGYLHKDVKAMVDDVVRELEKIPEVKECYEKWEEWQARIYGYYQDRQMPRIPLSQNPEFKSVKNDVIREAMALCIAEGKGKQVTSNNVSQKQENHDADAKPQVEVRTVLRLLKNLEKTFQGKVKNTQQGRRMITESKDREREIERKAALGQKSDGDEDITQSL